MSITSSIAVEIGKALKRLDADVDLLSIIGSYGDTLDDTEILTLLREYNAGRPIIHQIQ